jgi:hypothetical protein
MAWFGKFVVTECDHKQSGGARESVSDKKVEQINHVFHRSPTESMDQASGELQVPCMTLHSFAQTAAPVCIHIADCLKAEAR